MGESRCHRAWDPELKMWLHIPMCWGAAIGGPDQCSCTYPGSELERARAEVEEWKAEAHRERQRRAKANQRAAQAEERRTTMWYELNRLERSMRDGPAPARREEGP